MINGSYPFLHKDPQGQQDQEASLYASNPLELNGFVKQYTLSDALYLLTSYLSQGLDEKSNTPLKQRIKQLLKQGEPLEWKFNALRGLERFLLLSSPNGISDSIDYHSFWIKIKQMKMIT